MTYKKDFIKRERVDTNKEKGYYSGIKVIKEPPLRKDETFVLMFRNFIFFDVKSYECRNGDLYIRNIVDGVIIKRYFRMDGDDQLTVFKNRLEFDEFMKKVEEKGYLLGPEKSVKSYRGRLSGSINNERIKKAIDEASKTVRFEKKGIQSHVDNLSGSINNERIKKMTDEASKQFVLENFIATRNSETGKIDLITSTWDGSSITRDECPGVFDDVVRVLEENPGSAQFFNRNDFYVGDKI